jgi:hypothetical protein
MAAAVPAAVNPPTSPRATTAATTAAAATGEVIAATGAWAPPGRRTALSNENSKARCGWRGHGFFFLFKKEKKKGEKSARDERREREERAGEKKQEVKTLMVVGEGCLSRGETGKELAAEVGRKRAERSASLGRGIFIFGRGRGGKVV